MTLKIVLTKYLFCTRYYLIFSELCESHASLSQQNIAFIFVKGTFFIGYSEIKFSMGFSIICNFIISILRCRCTVDKRKISDVLKVHFNVLPKC